MKKLNFMRFLLIALVCVLAGCSSETRPTAQDLPLRKYVMEESGDPLKPSVSLEEDNRFMFIFSPLSSYIAFGSYKVNDDNLILKTDDGKYTFVFGIRNGSLIFNAEESSELPKIANIPDGAIFK